MQHYLQANFSTAMFKIQISHFFMYCAVSELVCRCCACVCVSNRTAPHGLVELDLGSVLLHWCDKLLRSHRLTTPSGSIYVPDGQLDLSCPTVVPVLASSTVRIFFQPLKKETSRLELLCESRKTEPKIAIIAGLLCQSYGCLNNCR